MPQPTYLLDTNICIYIRRERPADVLAKFQLLAPGSTAISVITYGELAYGVRKSGNPEQAWRVMEQLMSVIPPLPMTAEAAKIYGDIREDLSRSGEIIGNNDLWIAAHAVSLGLTLVTNNEREFSRVKNLRIENWAKEA
jgi:tRNA(fMet)-specific endonuclease VapC